MSNDAFNQSEEPTENPAAAEEYSSVGNPDMTLIHTDPMRPAWQVTMLEFDENGDVDPLIVLQILAILGISPSELAYLLELTAEVMTPLFPLPPVMMLLPYPRQRRGRTTDESIAFQNRAPFAKLAENTRRRHDAQTRAMRGGFTWHPLHSAGVSTEAFNAWNTQRLANLRAARTSDQGFDPRDSVRRVLPYAPQLSELIALGNIPADPSSYTNGLTPQDYQQAADNGNMLAAWQAGTNRARADFAPYVEDVEPTDDESTTNPE